MLRNFLALFLSLTTFLALGSCTNQPAPAGPGGGPVEVSFAIENDLTNLDPIKSQEPYSLQVIGQLFEGLVTLNERNELTPLLAETWTHNADFTTWQFQIRKDVFFHEDEVFGAQRTREVTADDVRDSFQRIVSKESYPAFVLADAVVGVADFQSGKADHVEGLRVSGPNTFEIRLQKPEPSFLHRITSPWFCVFPKEAVALGPDVFGRTKAIGTGPFKLAQRSDTEVVLEKNPRYWRSVGGNLDRVRFKVIKNEQIRLSELRNGNVALMRLPLALIPGVLNEEAVKQGNYAVKPSVGDNFEVRAFPTFNSHFIGFNCDKLDIHLRRAISLGINRRELVDAIAHGGGTLSTGTVPIGLLGYEPYYKDDLYDPEKARAELKLAKAGSGPPRIELLVHEKDNTEQLAQLVQSQLKPIGIEVSIQKLDYNAVVDRMVKGNTQAFALALEYVFSAPEPILNNIFNSEKIPVPNFWHYKNPGVDAELARLRNIGDRPQANTVSQAVEKQIVDDAPAAFLYQLKNLVIMRRELANVAFNGHSIPLLWEVRRSAAAGAGAGR